MKHQPKNKQEEITEMSQASNSRVNRPSIYNRAAVTAPLNTRAQLNTRALFRKALVAGVAALGIFGFLAGQSANASSESVMVAFEHITVHSGETLWQLAQEYGKGQDAREWIAAVVDLNGLSTVELQPGQDLALPRN
ncbi:MAG: LysM peptidoglycan-binding domain-containing protein [Micrococcales bacterium]